ncbi:DUF835 domain-containing protein [Thermococcus aciditolerans]|uniref:DUF835 domain-containing protein n=1 Tax=Thermococcus aciditolerans TaxID=2598455 RepID=A0A5C0SKS5_9EURY|nr:DUF835 domain-containing protein [Thermococcus aciditolerans]QEK14014.1 DUF835 domain-containing protein [Thermococcus aciditolerans]
MDGTQTILVVEASIVMLADLTAAMVIFKKYLSTRRKSVLAFSLAWIFDFIFVLASAFQDVGWLEVVGLISLPLFAGLMFYGSVLFMGEESLGIRHGNLGKMGLMPVMFMFYMYATYYYTNNALWTATVAASFGISGVFVVGAGTLLWDVREIYHSAVKYLSIGIIFFGLHLIPAAILGTHTWYMPVGFTLSMVLIVEMAWAMLRLVHMDTFENISKSVPSEIDMSPGVMVVDQKSYIQLKSVLANSPVLAFIRNVSDIPETWTYYFVTTVPFERAAKTLYPTDLAKMVEISYRYMEKVSASGGRGVVVIDCPEYLAVYNSWESLMKFLSKLRDIVVINNGTLILVVEKTSFDPQRYSQLVRLME